MEKLYINYRKIAKQKLIVGIHFECIAGLFTGRLDLESCDGCIFDLLSFTGLFIFYQAWYFFQAFAVYTETEVIADDTPAAAIGAGFFAWFFKGFEA